MYNVAILVRSAFYDNNKYYTEVFLKCLFKMKNIFLFIWIMGNTIKKSIYKKIRKQKQKKISEKQITQKIKNKKQKHKK